jgi:signal transduction histidine kinase
VYIAYKRWKHGSYERWIGLLIVFAVLGTNAVLLLGPEYVETASILAFVTRQAIAFAFMFAALNRSSARAESLGRQVLQAELDRAELVRKAKLAAMGRTLAGFAHELNTPIGTALTIASTMQVQIKQLQTDIATGQLRKTALNEFLDRGADGAQIVCNQLHRMGALIASFRSASKDYTDEAPVEVDVCDLLQKVCDGLAPEFQDSPVTLVTELTQHTVINTYPEHISSAVREIIENAKQHGFPDLEVGEIRVKLTKEAESVLIVITDNGAGIPENIRGRVFDPFFSGRIGGSIGMGLNTVYHLVTDKLKGTITVSAYDPQGARFEIRLPN